jgi:hypothetical protein
VRMEPSLMVKSMVKQYISPIISGLTTVRVKDQLL